MRFIDYLHFPYLTINLPDAGHAASYAAMNALSSHRPLHGRRILVTRAATQAAATTREITRRGGVPVSFPCLAVECLADNIRKALPLLESEDAEVAFSSSNGVHCVAEVMGKDFAGIMPRMRVAAVGDRTAAALRRHGIQPAIIPEQHSQDGLIRAYLEHGMPRQLVFFRAEEGREALAAALQQQGVAVHTIACYRTVCPQGDTSAVIDGLKTGLIDAVLLGSAKTARYFIRRIGDAAIANRAVIAVISPQVAAAAKNLGLNVQIVAKEASFASMLDGLAAHFQ